MNPARVVIAALLLTTVPAHGDATATPSVGDGSVPLWTSLETPSKVRFSRAWLEDWLCSPEPPGSEPFNPPPPEPPPPEEDPNGTEHENAEISCDVLDRYVPTNQDPFEPWRSSAVLEVSAAADALNARLRRLCLSSARTIELSCGSFAVDVRLDPLVEQPWSPLTLFSSGGAGGVYLGDLTVATETLFTHVENGWTARLPRTRTFSGFGHWADTLEGYPAPWPDLVDGDCDGLPETPIPAPASFRPATGREGGKAAECLFDVEGSGRLCWTSVPGLP